MKDNRQKRGTLSTLKPLFQTNLREGRVRKRRPKRALRTV